MPSKKFMRFIDSIRNDPKHGWNVSINVMKKRASLENLLPSGGQSGIIASPALYKHHSLAQVWYAACVLTVERRNLQPALRPASCKNVANAQSSVRSPRWDD